MYIWISLLGVTIVTFLLESVNPYYDTNTQSMLHIGDMFWYMFGALLTQGIYTVIIIILIVNNVIIISNSIIVTKSSLSLLYHHHQ